LAAALALAAQSLSGCSWLCIAPGPKSVTLIADPNANDDSAVAVDLVFISNKTEAKQVAALSASDFFSRREQLSRDFPDGMQVRSWELAPGQVFRDQPTDATCPRAGTVLFAHYATPGDHRQMLSSDRDITIWLNPQDFKVGP
jgi:type VI secretion system protein